MTAELLAPAFDDLKRLAARLHGQSRRFALAVTGGGSEAISALFTTPGASRTLLEALVPYSPASLVDLVGATPEQFCSSQTARDMAVAAWMRARSLEARSGLDTSAGSQATGWAATCSLATDRTKRGAHRAWGAVMDAGAVVVHGLLMSSDRSRADEERMVAAWLLNAAAEVTGLEERIALPLLDGEVIERFSQPALGDWAALLTGATALAYRDAAAGAETIANRADRLLLCGSFNPIHHGHREMAASAARKLGRAVDWEISAINVDKAPLDYLAMQQRLAQFGPDEAVWFTRAPKFVEKAKLFPRVTFIVGVDTIRRIGDPRYYHHDPARRDAEIAEMARHGARFLVFPRLDGERFVGLADLDLPPGLLTLCDGVGAEEFRVDVSSSELRRQAAAGKSSP